MAPYDTLLILSAMAGLGLAALVLIVGRDLGPAARLRRPQRLLLGTGLGLGVITIALKAVAIQLLAAGLGHPAPPLPQPVPPTEPMPLIEAPADVLVAPALAWTALPSVAPGQTGGTRAAARRVLGERLFHDPALSRDGSISCASCHDPRHGGAEGRRIARGIGGQTGTRNAPSVFNTAFQTRFFWDGRARSLEAQALGPLLNPLEMGNASIAAVTAHLAADPAYDPLFARAFGAGSAPSDTHVAAALAAYQRSLVTADTPYDRFVSGDATALSPQQQRGMWLFRSVGCATCHSGASFSRASLLAPDRGASPLRIFPVHLTEYVARYGLTQDLGAARSGAHGVWRVPSLRNVELTAPYFHNGAVDTLDEAVRVMAASQLGLRVADPASVRPSVTWWPDARRMDGHMPRVLSEADVSDLVAFLKALTSDRLRALAERD